MKRNLPLSPDTPASDLPNLSYILDLSPSHMTLGLGNIKRLLDVLGNPQRRFKSVVVAGTNGKGTVTALLSSILTAHGRRTGRLLSPHIYSVAERISVDDRPVALELIESAASRVAPLHREIEFSYFEAITAIAFLIFAEAGVDTAVLEVGLGGRFDATNSVDPVLTVLTSITLDHRRLLGATEEEIIREKLGITRSGVPLVCGGLRCALEEIVADKSKRDRFPVLWARDIGQCGVERLTFGSMRVSLRTGRCDYGELQVRFPGPHQADNVLLAAGAAERLLESAPRLSEGIGRAFLPGRFEHRLVEGRNIILDVAHNDTALTGVLDTLSMLSPPERNWIVLGLMRRKELDRFPVRAATAAKRIFLVQPPDGDACTPQELLARIGCHAIQSAGTDIVLVNNGSSGRPAAPLLRRLISAAPSGGTVLITGSHRMVELFGTILSEGDLS